MCDRWVAYPFQNNISNLPLEHQISCINGLIEAKVSNAVAKTPPSNFDEWIMRVMVCKLTVIYNSYLCACDQLILENASSQHCILKVIYYVVCYREKELLTSLCVPTTSKYGLFHLL